MPSEQGLDPYLLTPSPVLLPPHKTASWDGGARLENLPCPIGCAGAAGWDSTGGKSLGPETGPGPWVRRPAQMPAPHLLDKSLSKRLCLSATEFAIFQWRSDNNGLGITTSTSHGRCAG